MPLYFVCSIVSSFEDRVDLHGETSSYYIDTNYFHSKMRFVGRMPRIGLKIIEYLSVI